MILWNKFFNREGGSIAQLLAYLLPDLAAPGSMPSITQKISEEKIVDVAEVNQWRSSEESGQWLENVDPTYQSSTSKKLIIEHRPLEIKEATLPNPGSLSN